MPIITMIYLSKNIEIQVSFLSEYALHFLYKRVFVDYWAEYKLLVKIVIFSESFAHINTVNIVIKWSICTYWKSAISLSSRRKEIFNCMYRDTGCWPLPILSAAMAGRNHLTSKNTPSSLLWIGEWYSQTISNLCQAALLRRCEFLLNTGIILVISNNTVESPKQVNAAAVKTYFTAINLVEDILWKLLIPTLLKTYCEKD